jgi:PAS fold
MTNITKIDAFVQSSPHPAWLATSRGECICVNPALVRLTGLKSDQINHRFAACALASVDISGWFSS